MAITGGAALVGGIAAGTGAVSLTTVAIAGLAITAVGLVTGNKVLEKIGGGLGLGGGVGSAAAGLASGVGSAAGGAAGAATDAAGTTAPDAISSALGSSTPADAVDSSLAPGDVAESATTGSGAPLGFGSSDASAASTGGLAGGSGDAATSAVANVNAPVNAAANPMSGQSINANLAAGTSPAAQQASSPGVAAAVQGSSNPTADSIGQSLQTASGANGNTAPIGSAEQVGASGPVGTTGSGAPMGFNNMSGIDAGTLNGTGGGLQPPSSFFGQLSNWWGSLDGKEKLVVGQVGAGLVQGIGSGAMNMLSQEQQQKILQQQVNYQEASGSATPTVGITPNPGGNPYTAAMNQYAGPTPAGAQEPYPNAGLVNSARS